MSYKSSILACFRRKSEASPLRRRRGFSFFGLPLLEARQLLASLTSTFSSTVPIQATDFSAPISLPKFNPALGTLTEVDITLDSSGTQGGTLTNAASGAQTFTFEEDINLSLTDTATTLLSNVLTGTQNYTDLQPGASASFGPFNPTNSSTAVFTSGATFDEFNNGPGNVALSVQTLTGQTIGGGGGNISAVITTTAGATATVTYRYTATPVSISGNVYEDVTASGRLDFGDNPIAGVLLTLVDSDGNTVATTTTGPGGAYNFATKTDGSPLFPGTYTLLETQPAGYLQGTNTVGTVDGATDGTLAGLDRIGSIVLTSGQNSINNNFGEILPVTLSGNVYIDRTNAGVIQFGDAPIGGVTIHLLDASGIVATTTTAPNGSYLFTTTTSGAPLAPGTYTIVESQPAGFGQGATNVGTVNGVPIGLVQAPDILGSIGLRSGQNSISNNFGELLPDALNVSSVRRFGVHNQPTLVVLSFSTPLDPATAQNVFNYRIVGPTDSSTPGVIPIRAAIFDAATNTVTLQLGKRLQLHHPYTLTVTGLRSTLGSPLSGNNGIPGSPFTTSLNISELSGFIDRAGNFVPIDHGKIYPAAGAAAFKGKTFVAPSNLGSFASTNLKTFITATSGPNSDFQLISLSPNGGKFARRGAAVRGNSKV